MKNQTMRTLIMQMVILKTSVVKMKSPNKFPQMNVDNLCWKYGRQISEAINKRFMMFPDIMRKLRIRILSFDTQS